MSHLISTSNVKSYYLLVKLIKCGFMNLGFAVSDAKGRDGAVYNLLKRACLRRKCHVFVFVAFLGVVFRFLGLISAGSRHGWSVSLLSDLHRQKKLCFVCRESTG